MRRIFSFFFRPTVAAAPAWALSAEQREQVLALLSELGLRIVRDARGPVPLLPFSRALLDRLELSRPEFSHAGRIPLSDRIPLADFADALKRVIRDMQHDQLRVMSPTDMIGVGYVFNASDPETWPIRTSR